MPRLVMQRLGQRLVAEWLGTAFLLAAVVGSGIMAQKLAGGNVALALLCNTIPTGAILVVLILIFGPLSGRALQSCSKPCVRAATRVAFVDCGRIHRRANHRSSCRRMGGSSHV